MQVVIWSDSHKEWNYAALVHMFGLTGHEWSLTHWAEINAVIESQVVWLENGSQATFRCLF